MKIKKHFFSRNIKNIKIRISKPDLNEISKIFDLFLFQNVVILLNDISLKSRTISLLKALNISYYCLKRGEFIDLLFYNRELSCLVAFELKLGEFKAEYLGKMNLYLEALDRDVKKEQENPSVGVILCSSKDEDVVEYSISKNMSQTMISEYKLKLIDKKLLENKLGEMKKILEIEKQVWTLLNI